LHRPVLAGRIVELFDFEKGVLLDGTVGQGGHAKSILQAHPNLFVVCVDRDPQALDSAKTRLAMFSDRVIFIKSSFADLEKICGEAKEKFVGMILDLGLSLDQLKDSERGFSFQASGPLDMRFDPEQELTASDIVNSWSAVDLEKIFSKFADVREAKKVAAAIISARKIRFIETTGELANIIARVVRSRRIHPATKVFMALRIAVNRELEELGKFLEKFPRFLASGGKVAIVSFHSAEDRLVKRCFVSYAREGVTAEEGNLSFKLVFKKPLVPDVKEISENPRARSAKLRAIERTG